MPAVMAAIRSIRQRPSLPDCTDLTARAFEVWFDRMADAVARLTFHQEIQDAAAARERLVLVVGPIAAMSDNVRQKMAVRDPCRQGGHPYPAVGG